MALSESVLSDLLDAFRAGEGVDLIRDAVQLVLQELIEVEATEQIGAARYERERAADRGRDRRRAPRSTEPQTNSRSETNTIGQFTQQMGARVGHRLMVTPDHPQPFNRTCSIHCASARPIRSSVVSATPESLAARALPRSTRPSTHPRLMNDRG